MIVGLLGESESPVSPLTWNSLHSRVPLWNLHSAGLLPEITPVWLLPLPVLLSLFPYWFLLETFP